MKPLQGAEVVLTHTLLHRDVIQGVSILLPHPVEVWTQTQITFLTALGLCSPGQYSKCLNSQVQVRKLEKFSDTKFC